mmetsp:Transcript_10439/g.30677  ORF Transcript_10439/g.30677 Transcript_10439/m.30677 type:complete len:302 (+) Transcript_10439:682-1587(+)
MRKCKSVSSPCYHLSHQTSSSFLLRIKIRQASLSANAAALWLRLPPLPAPMPSIPATSECNEHDTSTGHPTREERREAIWSEATMSSSEDAATSWVEGDSFSEKAPEYLFRGVAMERGPITGRPAPKATLFVTVFLHPSPPPVSPFSSMRSPHPNQTIAEFFPRNVTVPTTPFPTPENPNGPDFISRGLATLEAPPPLEDGGPKDTPPIASDNGSEGGAPMSRSSLAGVDTQNETVVTSGDGFDIISLAQEFESGVDSVDAPTTGRSAMVGRSLLSSICCFFVEIVVVLCCRMLGRLSYLL